jgi:hypothetical protein
MTLLLTWLQQIAIKPLGGLNSANGVAQAKYNMLAAEVESYELDNLLGSLFYQTISTTPVNYTDLLDGSTFVNCTGETITHKGLRYVIAYLNYAKWIGESFLNDTATGVTQKIRPDSEKVSAGELRKLQNEYREIAFNAFKLTQQYIETTSDFDELWKKGTSKRVNRTKITGVRKTYYK